MPLHVHDLAYPSKPQDAPHLRTMGLHTLAVRCCPPGCVGTQTETTFCRTDPKTTPRRSRQLMALFTYAPYDSGRNCHAKLLIYTRDVDTP